jgi:hypothetical protein
MAREGKLKAAQWPNICLALVISLSKQWSTSMSEKEQHWLENLCHLFCLIRILYLHTVTTQDIQDFQQHSLLYLRGVASLFPSHRIKPNHHYLLHLGEMMRMYGPMRTWWSFPYERLNGDIQRIRTSNRSGIFYYYPIIDNKCWLMTL